MKSIQSTWIKQLHSIAQEGLTCAQSPFDIERYEMVQQIALEIKTQGAHTDINQLQNILPLEVGSVTAKIEVRGIVFHNEALLLVKDRSDEGWTTPGGGADVGESPSEAVVREIYEESGYQTRAIKLLAIYDRDKQGHSLQYPFKVYRLFFLCQLLGGTPITSIETSEVGFFREHEIPQPLSLARMTPAQITRMFEHYRHPEWPTDYD